MALNSRAQKVSAKGSLRRWWWFGGGTAGTFLLYYFVVGPVLTVSSAVPRLHVLADSVRQDLQHRDYGDLVRRLPALTTSLSETQTAVNRLGYLAWIPGVGRPFNDARDLVATAYDAVKAGDQLSMGLKPLLLSHHQHSHAVGLATFLNRFPTLWPSLDRALPNLVAARKALDRVDFTALPASLKMLKPMERYRPELDAGITVLQAMVRHQSLVRNMLGMNGPQRYLLILENNGELRAGGGFITAYGYLTLKNGVPQRHADIRAISVLQKQTQYHPPTPWPIDSFWPKLQYWGVRDSALSPDMPTNARVIERFYDAVPHHRPIAGVVFVDTWMADSLIRKSGALHLGSQYGNVKITAHHANQTLEYVAERLAVRQAQDKAFLGTLMSELRSRFLHASGGLLTAMLGVLQEGLKAGHMAFYFNNPREEALARQWGAAGNVPKHVGGDYLSVVNDNLGAHKDNFFLQTSVSTSITHVANGSVQQTTTMRWTMPKVSHGWLVVPYYGWIDLYVPYGSKLVSAAITPQTGVRVTQNRSLNKTLLGFRVYIPSRSSLSAPAPSASATLVYTLPPGTNVHRLTIQKQPGMFAQTVTVNDGAYHQSFYQTQNLRLGLP